MVPKTYSLKIFPVISALFFQFFCTPSQAEHICDLEYSFYGNGPGSKCVSGKGLVSETRYSCAAGSCTKVHFDKCYAVFEGPRGPEPDLRRTVPPSSFRSYRATGYSNYVEAYVGPTPPIRFLSSPEAFCETPEKHTHCTSCTIYK
ncbi:hypothetical protein O181_016002 [Austropuccinia psidii MF-1]|uniref:Secreted protein n=1 Tax=Austropuccinia psidii MF-1 TaxID=1389203 RepID=A0A9Q3C357_9BASI|nr:hypothetical protein [Austropuccinia psidii MF-1]